MLSDLAQEWNGNTTTTTSRDLLRHRGNLLQHVLGAHHEKHDRSQHREDVYLIGFCEIDEALLEPTEHTHDEHEYDHE